MNIRKGWKAFLSAVQFLTQVPVPLAPCPSDSLVRAVKFFPLVGFFIGASAGLIHFLLAPHLSRLLTALLIVIFLVSITGCLHEDGLADAADGFGGGWNRDQILLILRDSRIGSYGAAVLTLSLLARVLLLSSIPSGDVVRYLIAAHVLSRWTTLPLSFYLSAARATSGNVNDAPVGGDGQGARIATLTTTGTLVWGTLLSFGVVGFTLRSQAIAPIVGALMIALLSGLYYKRKLGGVTGDCFGATNQLTEIATYLCGAWIV